MLFPCWLNCLVIACLCLGRPQNIQGHGAPECFMHVKEEEKTPRYLRVMDVAQSTERRTGTPLTQVRFPGAARCFPPRVNFQCRLPYDVRTPPCANRMHLHLCARERSRRPCQSSLDYGHTKTPSMHRRLGSATLSQLAFPGKGNPNFP